MDLRKNFKRSSLYAIFILVLTSLGCENQEIILEDTEQTENKNAKLVDSNEIAELDWCYEHSVPESECTGCNSALVAEFKETGDWCAGCGLPESHCRVCNPEIEFPQEIILRDRQIDSSKGELDWCYEHSVPESRCTICNPSLIAEFKQSGDWCAGHDLPESHCRLCNPEIEFPQEVIIRDRQLNSSQEEIQVSLFFRANSNDCATDGALIQFASSETAERTGITLQTLHKADQTNITEAPAEIVFDETETLVISTTVSALVSNWIVSPGDIVFIGDVLAILQSPNIADLKSTLISKHSDYEIERKELGRHKVLKSRDLISEADYDKHYALAKKAEAEFIRVKGLLLSAGLDENDINSVISNSSASNTFSLRAGSSGIIAERVAKLGRLYEAGEALAMVANPNAMWIEAQLSEAKLKSVKLGQEVVFTSDDGSMNRVGGKVIWISRFLDRHTRTGTIRARVLDRKHNLNAGEFGRVKIIENYSDEAVLVPKDAVQWEGCCNVVFVKETVDRYRPRKVEIIDSDGPYYQALGGINAGEQVVVDGSFLLKTELKKSSIGAGCCGLEAVG